MLVIKSFFYQGSLLCQPSVLNHAERLCKADCIAIIILRLKLLMLLRPPIPRILQDCQ